jgi:hypothetical protein
VGELSALRPLLEAGAVKAEADMPEREALRYAGKSFAQWRKELHTELKPELRIEGIKAMGTFGANGYGTEATTALLSVMRGYGSALGESGKAAEEVQVIQAGWLAIRKIGPEALPSLRSALGHPHRDVRRFAITALEILESEARAAVPELLRAINDRDPFVAGYGCKLSAALCPEQPGLASALGRALRSKEATVRAAAADALGCLGAAGRPAVVGLLEGVQDPFPGVRASSITALLKLEADPKLLVPTLVALLPAERDAAVVQAAVRYFQAQAARPQQVVPALVGMLKDGDPRCTGAILALGALGPAARDALPALKHLEKNATGERGKMIETTVHAIDTPATAAVPAALR